MQTNPFIMESGDYLAYVHYYRYRQTWATRIIMFGTLALLLLSGLVVFLLGLVEYVGIFLFMAAVLAVYFFIVLGYLLPHWGYALAKGRGDYGKPCTVVINETHVGATSETVDLKKALELHGEYRRDPQARLHLFQ